MGGTNKQAMRAVYRTGSKPSSANHIGWSAGLPEISGTNSTYTSVEPHPRKDKVVRCLVYRR